MKNVKLLSAKNYSSFLGRIVLQVMIDLKIYCLSTNTLELEFKKYKGIDYVLSWKSKATYFFKVTPFYMNFLNSTKLSGYRTGIKLGNSILVVEQYSYTTKL